jgi:putative transposase
MTAGLFVNGLYANADGDAGSLVRVLVIDDATGQVATISMGDGRAVPTWHDAVELRQQLASGVLLPVSPDPDPVRVLVHDSALSVASRQARDRRLDLIRDMVDDPERPDLSPVSRAARTHQAMVRFRVSRQTIYTCLRLYWKGGQIPSALTPAFSRRGAPGVQRDASPEAPQRGRPRVAVRADADVPSRNATPAVRSKLIEGALRLYQKPDERTGKPRSVRQAYIKTLEEKFAKGFEQRGDLLVPVLPPIASLPTEAMFRYYLRKSLDPAEVLRMRAGERKYLLKHRPLRGTTAGRASGPGSIYQVDATVFKTTLVSSLKKGVIIGHAVGYFVTDVFTGGLAGIGASLRAPSWLGLAMALENAFTDKVEFCRRYGITIERNEWPHAHIPRLIVADRGAEMLAKHGDHAARNLGFALSNLPPYRPDWKPLVERLFGRVDEDVLNFVPGATDWPRERGERDAGRDAVLTLGDFIKILIRFALYYNKSAWVSDAIMHPDAAYAGAERTPLGLWKWGIENRSGELRTVAPEVVQLHLLPREECAVGDRGLSLNSLHYVGPAVDRTGGMIRNSKRRRAPRLTVAYDPRDVGAVWACEGGQRWEALELHPNHVHFRGRTLEEVKEHRKSLVVGKREVAEKQIEAALEFDAGVKAVLRDAGYGGRSRSVKTATQQRGAAPLPGDRKDSLRAARAEERRHEDRSQPRRVPDVQLPSAQRTIGCSDASPKHDQRADRYVGRPDRTPMLRAALGSADASAEHSGPTCPHTGDIEDSQA